MNGSMIDHEDKLSASMTVLERRWEEVSTTVRDLREQIASKDEQIADLETQLQQQTEIQESLNREKAEIIARIEGLLARFEELGS